MNRLTTRFGATALKQAFIFGMIGALLMRVVVVQSVSSTTLGSGSLKLDTQSYSDDSAVTIAAKGIKVIGSTDGTPGGTTSPGTAVSSSLPEVTTAVTKNNYAYVFEVKESGDNTLTGSETYKIEVYGDNGITTSLLATFYMNQASAEALAVEGVTATVDVGSSTDNSYDIVVTKQ